MISVLNDRDLATLKIEGKLAEPWAGELNRAWRALPLGSRRLCLDLCGITYVDRKGRHILREIFRSTGAEIIADSPLTRQFAREISTASAYDDREN